MRSSTEVYWRNRDSAGGSRDSSSKRKYWDTNRRRRRSAAALAELGAPACIDSAARYRPAGQPSVRSVSSDSSLGFELDTCRLQQQPGLALVQPEVRHADLVHTALRPPAGKRQRRRFPARDRDLRAGREVLDQRREHVQTGQAGDRVQIVEHQHQRALERGQRAPDTRDAFRPGRSSRARQRIQHLGRERFDAMDRGGDVPQEHQRRRRRRPSSATHANGRGSASAHPASSVVLPYPAGATTVTKREGDAQSRAITSGFATVPGRVAGAASLSSRRSNGTFATATAGSY